MKLEREQWKPIHQERIKEGKLRSWYLFRVQFPSGAEESYNYVTVADDRFGRLEDPYGNAEELRKELHPIEKPEDFLNRTFKAKDHVRSEVWVPMDQSEQPRQPCRVSLSKVLVCVADFY